MKLPASAFGFSLICCVGATPLALAQGPNVARDLAANCFTCHGTNGNSVGGVPPVLAGRVSAELYQSMKDFQSGKRPSTIMQQHAKGYTDRELQLISSYFAAQKRQMPRVPPKAAD